MSTARGQHKGQALNNLVWLFRRSFARILRLKVRSLKQSLLRLSNILICLRYSAKIVTERNTHAVISVFTTYLKIDGAHSGKSVLSQTMIAAISIALMPTKVIHKIDEMPILDINCTYLRKS